MKTEHTARETYLTPGQIKKLSAAVAKRNFVSLMISQETKSLGTEKVAAVKIMLTQQKINKLDQGKPFLLKQSVAQLTAMANHGGFFGPAFSVIASAIPKILPVLGTLGLAAATGAVSGATKRAISGDGIKQIYR